MAKKRRKPPQKQELTKVEQHEITKQEQQRKATFRGFLRYIQRHGASLRDIWDSERIDEDELAPYIKDVLSWSAFTKAAAAGQWRLRRDEHWREVSAKVLAHVQTEAVQAEISEIAALESMRGLVLERIVGNAASGIMPAIPKSLEGAVGAFIQLDKRISQKREIVTEDTASAAANGGGRPGTTAGDNRALTDSTPLTEEEIAAMSRALAVQRSTESEDQAAEVHIPTVLSTEEEPHGSEQGEE